MGVRVARTLLSAQDLFRRRITLSASEAVRRYVVTDALKWAKGRYAERSAQLVTLVRTTNAEYSNLETCRHKDRIMPIEIIRRSVTEVDIMINPCSKWN